MAAENFMSVALIVSAVSAAGSLISALLGYFAAKRSKNTAVTLPDQSVITFDGSMTEQQLSENFKKIHKKVRDSLK